MYQHPTSPWRQGLASMLLVLALAVWASAQTVTGTLQGYARDTNGAFVPGVTVTIKNTETGQERTVTTNGQGYYIATFMPLGRYTATAVKSGFGNVVRENVAVTLNNTTAADFTLNPTVTESVTVTSDAAPINTSNAEVKGSLTTQEILDRPTLNQTNFLTLAETFSGFQENPTSGQNNPTLSSGSSINFNGTGTRGATFQINGVNNDDSSENQNRQGVSFATIKEFQVIQNNFTAEFGRGYGAVVLVQTIAGTNKIHGSTYLFHNNSGLNARSYFNHLQKPVNRRNQFGSTVGFPIFKNKLFGFVSYDHTENTGANLYVRDVFLPSERNPATWFLQTPANDTPANRAFIASVLARFPTTLLPNDPRSARTSSGSQGFNFPARDYSGRFDWNPRQNDTFFARWQYTRQRFNADDIILGERADQNNKQQNIGFTWTHLFSQRTVGEFRYGLGLRTTLVNIAAGNDTPIIRFANPIPISGSIIGNAGAFPIQRYQTDNQFVYNLSHLLGGNHFIKAGADLRRQKLDDLADNFSRGFYNITGTCNGVTYRDPNLPAPNNISGFYAFLNGCATTFQRGYGPFFLENRIREYNFYAEDTWKAKPNLTLNIGFRYEYVQAPREAKDRVNYVYGSDTNNYEPRVAIAYSPKFKSGVMNKLFGDHGQSSFRAGYGIYHGRLFQSVFSQSGATVRFNPPNAFFYNQTGATTALFTPTNLTDPTNGFVFTPGPQTARHSEALIDPDLEMPYTQQWSASYEREFFFKSSIRATYTGNRGIGLLRFALDNLPDNNPAGVVVANHPNNAPNVLYGTTLPAADPRRVDVRGMTLVLAANAACAGTGLSGVALTTACPAAVTLAPNEYSARVPRANERRPRGDFSTNTQVSNGSWSYYHGLQLEWNKRLAQGLNFTMNYTWSKTLDTTSEATAVGAGDSNQTGNNARTARGLSRFHTPHRFTFLGTYRTPFFKNRKDFLGQALGGWQFSMIMRLAAGTPFTVINGTGLDLNFDSVSETRPVLINPAVLGRGIGNPNTSQDLLNRADFRAPTLADFGCCILGRNTFFSDGVQNTDIGITKNFKMPFEGHTLLLRADMFNAFNRVQYGFPNADFTSATFGRITGTGTQYAPRSIQLAVRYQF